MGLNGSSRGSCTSLARKAVAAALTPTIPGNFVVRAGENARPDARRYDITYQPVHTRTHTHATVIGRRAIAISRPSVVAAGELAVSLLSLARLQAATKASQVRSSAKLYDHAKF